MRTAGAHRAVERDVCHNEDASIFEWPAPRTDIVIDPRCLHFGRDAYKGTGVLVDKPVRASTTSK